MIIGLTGKKFHGKDTVGRILVEEHGYARVGNADALKESAAALFGIEPKKWDEWKNDPAVCIEIVSYDGEFHESNPDGRIEIVSMSVRQFLQRYGTEAHRDIEGFGEDVWVEIARARIEDRLPRVVVTDVRFDNEAALIREFGGLIVEVYRPQVVDDGDAHVSEDMPRADLMLYNGDDIETLRQRIAQSERNGWIESLL